MSKTVVMAMNPLDPSSWEYLEAEEGGVRALIAEHLGTWPAGARIYDGHVAQVCDVTPAAPEDVAALEELEGPIFVVNYPGDPITIIIAVVAVAAVAAAAFLLAPKVPTAALRNTQSSSPNNELSDRTNASRVNGRVPDIFGQVRSTPDLIAVPYKIFQSNQELEVAYMCVGRGRYNVTDVRDDTTPISQIAGASVEVYGPYTSPNSGDAAQLTIGTPIGRPVVTAKRTNSVNGQTLEPPSGASNFSAYCEFIYPDRIVAADYTSNYYYDPSFGEYTDYSIPTDFTQYFSEGGQLSLSTASYTEGATTVSLSGSGYSILSVSATEIVLSYPTSVNGDWNNLDDLTGDMVPSQYATMSSNGVGWIGPFILDLEGTESVLCNFVALNGLYKDDGNNQYAASIQVEVELTPVNAAGVAIGSPETFSGTVVGSATDKETKALTLECNPTFSGRMKVRARRLTDKDTAFKGSVIDEVKWRDCYAIAPVSQADFGDVTTVQSVTRATDGALAVKDRKLNLLATRLLPQRDSAITPVHTNTAWDPITRAISKTGGLTDTWDAVCHSTESYAGSAYFSFLAGSSSPRLMGGITTDPGASTSYTSIDFAIQLDFASYFIYENGAYTGVTGGYSPGDYFSVQYIGNKVIYAVNGEAVRIVDTAAGQTMYMATAFYSIGSALRNATFSALTTTRRAADVLCAMCIDPKIGRRPYDQVDMDNIYTTQYAAEAYFGVAEAAEFSYTFDKADLSFEESAQMVATATFCQAYRRGSLIRLALELPKDDSVLLFNHRNKVPGSETRTVAFGNGENYDGVAYEYVSPDDDAVVTLYVPQGDASAVNPQKIESVGVRSYEQAYIQAWRAWNKIKYQTTSVEFEAMQEADLLVLTDRVLVADNTRPDTMDGDVLAQDVLSLTLSQPVALDAAKDYTAFLQLADGTVEAIAVVQGASDREVVLAEAPAAPLTVDDEASYRTTYAIVGPDNERTATPFLVSEKDPQEGFTVKLKAVNYDARYYANDLDMAG